MIEMKSHKKNLHEAMNQALDYYKELKQSDLPKYMLACDFQNWYLLDKQDNSQYFFSLSELADNIGLFGFMTDKPMIIHTNSVNRDTVQMIAKIFDELKKADFGSEPSSYFLTRIVFCLFADDTGIFPDRNMFQDYIKETEEDGSNTGSQLRYLFENVLNTHRDDRSKNMGQKVRFFPHINGDLFSGGHKVPDFNQDMRKLLIKSGEYDWSKVSPAIFGTMFQTVMDPDARRETGSHYTTEENIFKVIRPLFLDNLNKEFDEIDRLDAGSKKDIFIKFQNKLASMKFLDPACGSGNFLVIAYRELRRLEHRTIVKIYGFDKEKMDTEKLSKMNVNQFFGIEIGAFSAKIAEVSLWMMDHMMNVELSDMIDGLRFRRIPISEKPNIKCGDALEFDWNEFLPARECDYVFGNPPFGGIRELNEIQNEQLSKITKHENQRGMLDYVTAWFIKSAEYVTLTTPFCFVATSSIVEGDQVKKLSDILIKKHKMIIILAHKSFLWDSESRGKASVYVVIVGMAKKFNGVKYIFSDNKREKVKNITPYLKQSSSSIMAISRESHPINGFPDILVKGMAITDDDNYVFDPSRKEMMVQKYPEVESYFRPYITAKGLLHNIEKWVLLVYKIPPNLLSRMNDIKILIDNVAEFRKQSKKENTRVLGDTPKKFERPIIPKNDFLVIPVVSSSTRKYLPVDILNPPKIASAATIIGLQDTIPMELFAILSSKMHMLWLKTVGGKLKNDCRYSNITYNIVPIIYSSPLPDTFDRRISKCSS